MHKNKQQRLQHMYKLLEDMDDDKDKLLKEDKKEIR